MKNLKELRKKLNISQQEIADYLNISNQAYGYYENDKREADYKTLTKLSDYFNVSIDYLLDRDITKLQPHSITTIGREGQRKTKVLSEEKWKAINALLETMDDENDKKK